MGSKSQKIQELGITNFKGASLLSRDIESTKRFGLDDSQGYAACKSFSSMVGPEEKKKLLSQEDLLKVGNKVRHESTMIPIPLSLSKLSLLINSIKTMTPEHRLEMRPFILNLYDKYKEQFYVYSLLNLIGTVLFFTTIVFQVRSPFIYVPFYLIYLGMIVFEMIDVFSKGTKYFKSVYNWFDVILYPVAMGLNTSVLINGYDFLKDELPNLVVVLILYLALLRAVSMLRVLDSTRYLILMILRVYLDMTPFFVVLLFYIFGNGCIYILINITNGEQVFEWREFKRASDLMYNWGYGNWDDPNEMNELTFVFYLHTGLFIGLVMFNLLIAIISGTYEQFTEDRVMIDLEEILDMLDEMSNFKRVMYKIGKRSKYEQVYYHFLVSNQSEDQLKDIQDTLDELGEKHQRISENQKAIRQNLNELAQNIQEMKENGKQVRERLERNQAEMKENQENIRENLFDNQMQMKDMLHRLLEGED